MQERRYLTIIVVEDDPDDRLLIELELKNIPFPVEVIFVAGEEELLEWLDAYRQSPEPGLDLIPPLILIEPFTLRLNLGRALARIQALEGMKHAPVVVLSSSIEEAEYLKERYPLEGVETLVKPVKGVQLAGLLAGNGPPGITRF